MIARFSVLAALLLQQPIGLEDQVHLRMYLHHRERFAHFHNQKLVNQYKEYIDLETEYLDLLKFVDVTRKVPASEETRQKMIKKAKEIQKELERIEKEWQRVRDRLQKIP